MGYRRTTYGYQVVSMDMFHSTILISLWRIEGGCWLEHVLYVRYNEGQYARLCLKVGTFSISKDSERGSRPCPPSCNATWPSNVNSLREAGRETGLVGNPESSRHRSGRGEGREVDDG
eukprot:92401-Pleurochrysis_carterae.AAC.1